MTTAYQIIEHVRLELKHIFVSNHNCHPAQMRDSGSVYKI